MSITLEQIKSDIKSGKSKAIYLSDKFLWWTHLEDDLIQATEMGIEYMKDKTRIESILIGMSWHKCDPIGSKVIINKEPGLFIARTLMNPKHYGKHRIQAFMKAHHQNCNNFYSNKWQGYNNLIDREKK